MTLTQCRFLTRLLVRGPFEVSTCAATARACAVRGWCQRDGGLCCYTITDAGRAALKYAFPEIIELHQRSEQLSWQLMDLELA